MTFTELDSEIADRYFRQGLTQKEIAADKSLGLTHAAVRKRIEHLYRCGRVRYIAPDLPRLAKPIENFTQSRTRVQVVETSVAFDVASRGAQVVLELMRAHKAMAPKELKNIFHLGILGGRTPGMLGEALAEALLELPDEEHDVDEYPKSLILHSLIGDLHGDAPLIDPNTNFFSHFHRADAGLRRVGFEVRYESLPAPGIAMREELKAIERLELVSMALSSLDRLNLLIAGAGHPWKCRFTVFEAIDRGLGIPGPADDKGYRHRRDTYTAATNRLQQAWLGTTADLEEKHGDLSEHPYLGDFAWFPVLGGKGPINTFEAGHHAWAVTAFSFGKKLDALRELISPKDLRLEVLLVCAPCGGCAKAKSELLRAILKGQSLATRLVVDSQTAREFLDDVSIK